MTVRLRTQERIGNMSTQSPYETRGEYLNRTLCDNAAKRYRGIGISPKCYDGGREYECTVYYDKHGIETSTMVLCSECMKNLKKDCRKHKYRFKSKKVKT